MTDKPTKDTTHYLQYVKGGKVLETLYLSKLTDRIALTRLVIVTIRDRTYVLNQDDPRWILFGYDPSSKEYRHIATGSAWGKIDSIIPFIAELVTFEGRYVVATVLGQVLDLNGFVFDRDNHILKRVEE